MDYILVIARTPRASRLAPSYTKDGERTSFKSRESETGIEGEVRGGGYEGAVEETGRKVFALVPTSSRGLTYDCRQKSPTRHSRLIHLLDSAVRSACLHSLGNYNAIAPPRADKRQTLYLLRGALSRRIIFSPCEKMCRTFGILMASGVNLIISEQSAKIVDA